MGQTTLVKERIEDGQRLLTQLVADQFEVTAAAWICDSENDRWRLYVASPVVDRRGGEAYLPMLLAMRKLGNSSLDWHDIKAIGPSHPVTLEILDYQRRFPPEILQRYRNARLGDLYIEEAYIYPQTAMTQAVAAAP